MKKCFVIGAGILLYALGACNLKDAKKISEKSISATQVRQPELVGSAAETNEQILEVYAEVNDAVGNIAYAANGDLVYSLHPFFDPKIKVMKYNAESKTSVPFPNLQWNTPHKDDDQYFGSVLGVRNDVHGIVWMLDMGLKNKVRPKIVGWDDKENRLHKIYYLPESCLVATSQPNDMVVDTKHNVFVIADEGIGDGGDGSKAALVVIDMNTGKARRLLQGTRTTLPENNPTIISGKTLAVNGKPLLVGCDGITADAEFKWLYYCPLNGRKIYRIKFEDLLNESISEKQLDKMVETYSSKPNNGGLSIDKKGNLYLTELEHNSISLVMAEDRTVHRFVSDQKMLWPDGVSYNAVDGYMYVSAAQVHLGAVFNKGRNLARAPYYIFRFKPLAQGVPFR